MSAPVLKSPGPTLLESRCEREISPFRCRVCNAAIVRKEGEALDRFAARRTCSPACADTARRCDRRRSRQPSPIAALVERVRGRLIYLIASPAMASPFADLVADQLSRRYPAARFILSRGRYGSREAWLARWPQERERYGGGIVLTAGEPLDDEAFYGGPTGGAIGGRHMIGDGAAREIVDLVAMARPVAWLPYWGWRTAEIATFAVEQPGMVSGPSFARIFHAADATPLVPAIGPFDAWPLPPIEQPDLRSRLTTIAGRR